MDIINPAIGITAAARFDSSAATCIKNLKQQWQAAPGTDARRISRLSLLAALGAVRLREKAEIRSSCAVYLATPFSSPSLFGKMAENVLAHRTAMPFDFIANLHNAPAFYAAQALGAQGPALVVAADDEPESWPQVVYLAAAGLYRPGQQAAVGWCCEQPPQAEGGREGSIWILLEYGAQHGTGLAAAFSRRPSENPEAGQGAAAWFERLQAV